MTTPMCQSAHRVVVCCGVLILTGLAMTVTGLVLTVRSRHGAVRPATQISGQGKHRRAATNV
jgi:hypothetical protein